MRLPARAWSARAGTTTSPPYGTTLGSRRLFVKCFKAGRPQARGARVTALVTDDRPEYLTESQRATLAAELAELEGPRRARAVQAIRTAREHGDLSENFEYHAAKTEQGLLEARIRTLRARLLDAVTIDESEVVQGAIAAGSIVELELEAGERMEVEISSVSGPGTVSPCRRSAARSPDTGRATRSPWRRRAAPGAHGSGPSDALARAVPMASHRGHSRATGLVGIAT